MFASLLIALVGLSSSPAEAAVHVSVSAPGISVNINPWSPYWSPAPRAGYRWTAGHYEGRSFVPGYWIPEYARAGYVWVPGYWDGYSYVEGYWRPAGREGYRWVTGTWYGGVYYTGGWVSYSVYRPGVPVYAYRTSVIHERAEDRRERYEWHDRDHAWQSATVHREAAQDRNENRYDYHQDHRNDDHQQAYTSHGSSSGGSSSGGSTSHGSSSGGSSSGGSSSGGSSSHGSSSGSSSSGGSSSGGSSSEGASGSTGRPPRDNTGAAPSTSSSSSSHGSSSHQQADSRRRR